MSVGHGDQRVTVLSDELAALPASPTEAQLTRIRTFSHTVATATHEVSRLMHCDQRQFRNLLRKLTLGLALLGLVVMGLSLFTPVPAGWVPMPAGATAAGHVVTAAFLLGALGALFSAIPSITLAPANSTTFNPTVVQAAFKIVVGGWSALVGLAAVSAGLQAADSDPASPAGFAMMCAVFGAMQEAITRFADRGASNNKPTTT